MDPIVMVVIGAGVVLVIVAVAMLAGGNKQPSLEGRLRSFSDDDRKGPGQGQGSGIVKKKTTRKQGMRDTFGEHVFKPLAGMMGTKGHGQDKLRELLVYAGIRRKGSMEVFLGVKMLLMLGLPGLTLAFLIFMWTRSGKPIDYASLIQFMVAACVLGMLLPNIWLKRKAKARQEEVRCSLPDALDLMVVCVEAGLGLDQALLKISEELHESAPELCEELMLLNLELRAGKPREDCLRNFGLRSGVEEAKSLAARIIQATKFGTNLATSLRVFSDSMRLKRRQAAEEKAAKTTIKLLFPLVFFIFPAIFVVILGPAGVQIARTFGLFE